MKKSIQNYLREIGKKGGQISRRKLSSDDARRMVRIREARRAFRNFHTLCFWSFDPKYVVGEADITWVAQQLRQHGDRKAWEVAGQLCP